MGYRGCNDDGGLRQNLRRQVVRIRVGYATVGA